MVEVSGIRQGGRQNPDIIPATAKIRPLRDHIVVKPLPWEPSKTLKVVYQGNALRGEVLAVGPGCYPKLYNKDRSKSWNAKQFRPCDVKVGDIVELGGLEIRGYQFHEFTWGDQPVLMCREADVTMIVAAH